MGRKRLWGWPARAWCPAPQWLGAEAVLEHVIDSTSRYWIYCKELTISARDKEATPAKVSMGTFMSLLPLPRGKHGTAKGARVMPVEVDEAAQHVLTRDQEERPVPRGR
jgi:hypothetical protein